jgi:hypothetical protein
MCLCIGVHAAESRLDYEHCEELGYRHQDLKLVLVRSEPVYLRTIVDH